MRRRALPYLANYWAEFAQIWCVVPMTHGIEFKVSINVTNSTAHARYDGSNVSTRNAYLDNFWAELAQI